jgi:hypothetical protein
MRKILFWCGLSIVLAVGGMSYYFWNQVTQLPSEYTEDPNPQVERDLSSSTATTEIKAQAAASKQRIASQIQKSAIGNKVELTVSDRDLNNLVSAQLATRNPQQTIPVGIKAIDTKIVDGKLQAGAIVNLGELLQGKESSENVDALTKLADKLPFLKDRDIYVGIEGKPEAKDGKIKFDRDTQIKVGKMSLTIAQLAANLGVSEAKIEQLINLKLEQQNLQIERINLDGDRLKIEGKRK